MKQQNMNYKIIGNNDYYHIPISIFTNRGITNVSEYTHLTDDVLISYDNLDNITETVQMLDKHIKSNSKMAIIVDCDVDGQCSAAMMYSYLKRLNKEIDITYLIHSGKQHGISSEIEIPESTKLLIVPDAGSNDTEQCKQLTEQGIDILVLDHHDIERTNPYAVIVNNQCSSEYSNKNLCGAGVVYKFLQALDDYYWNDYADDYLDLVSLANISDIMDLRSFETKRLIDKGLYNVTNKCFEEFINAQNYSMKGKVNPHTIAFCITSLINAMCRVGDMEEKDLLFRAFIEQDEEEFEYKKRGETENTKENIYQRAVRLCKNAKSRQDNQVKKLLPALRKSVNNDENTVLFLKGNNIPSVFSGLIAMKMASYAKKPCLILRKDEENNVYRGSARNFDNSYVLDLKAELLKTDLFNWCQGHANAFGFEIKAENVAEAIKVLNKNINSDNPLPIDFCFDYDEFNIGMISDVTSLENCYGTGIKEPLFVINNIVLEHNQGVVMGKNEDTWKFITDDNIAIIKFCNPSDDKVLDFLNGYDDEICINALCQLNVSEYKGVITPQIVILKYEEAKNV